MWCCYEILSQAHLSPSLGQEAYAEHLTQAPQPVFAATQQGCTCLEGFHTLMYSCLEGENPTSVLLVPDSFYNSINL